MDPTENLAGLEPQNVTVVVLALHKTCQIPILKHCNCKTFGREMGKIEEHVS